MADSDLLLHELRHNAPAQRPNRPHDEGSLQSPARWLLYLGLTMFCGGLLVVLENSALELSALVFTLVILFSGAVCSF